MLCSNITIKSEFTVDDYVENNIKNFPNPFTDEITVEIEHDYQQIEIYDLNGMVVFTTDMKSINSK